MKKFLISKVGLSVLVIIIIVVLVVSIFRINIFTKAEGVIIFGFSPIQRFFNDTHSRINNFFNYFDDINEIKNENDILKNEIADLTSENFKLSDQIENIGIILDEYEYIANYNFEAVLGKIISRGSDNYLRSMLINKGTYHGVQIGYPAVANSGYIIGQVVEVNNYTSKVLLINDIHSKISANIKNELNSSGVLVGEFGISLKLELIPYDHEINIGDIVVSSGLEKDIPANLIIGKISNITKSEGELFQSATIDQIINTENLKIITIILPAND